MMQIKQKDSFSFLELIIFRFLIATFCPVSVVYLSLYSDDEELHGEAQDVSGVKTMPNRQKEECGHMREGFIAQEFQPLEDMSEKRKEKKKKKKIR